MKKILILPVITLLIAGCDIQVIDTTPPSLPRGIVTTSLDNAVQLDWVENTDRDLAGYHVWVSDSYNGRYTRIGTTKYAQFVDNGARNGQTYYYGVTAFDFEGNESEMSQDVVYDTPRPEGFGVRLYDYLLSPASAGYDFSTFSVGQYDDNYTDFFYEFYNGRAYLDVWNDSDIQDMGYTVSLDDISVAPTSGWSPSRSVEAIPGHTYVIWTWDDHYAKVRVRDVTSNWIVFDWAYQTAPANPELHRAVPPGGLRKLERRPLARQ